MSPTYLVLVLSVAASPMLAAANNCNVSGTVYDAAGRPLSGVVRLVDRQTNQTDFRSTGARAQFDFDDLKPDDSGQRYRLDLLGPPTVVTGSRIPTRSIVGMASRFACIAGRTAHVDLRVQAD